MTTVILLWILVIVLIVIGLAGTVFPALPGPALVFVALVLAAWIDEFQHVGGVTLTVLGLLTLLSWVVDFVATARGAERVGASRLAVVGAIVGTVIGVLFGLLGILLGPFIGAALGELISQRRLGRAVKAGAGTWLGLVFGTLAKLALVCAMLGIFALVYLL